MFSACRRGPASIARVFRAGSATVRVPSTRPSTLSLSWQSTAKPTLEARWLHVSQLRNQYAATRSFEQTKEDLAESPRSVPTEITEFSELIDRDLVHRNVVEAITVGMGHETMTQVQSMTISQALQGTDILAQARTGTGKTIGFLLPTIQNILRKNPELATRKRYSRARPSDIRAIIISPTRELAEQIAVEADKLCFETDLRVQVAVGGNSKRSMLKKMQREGCHLLVATPGRLHDLLTDDYSRVAAPALNTLILDEADRLLDAGFADDIAEIIRLLPKRHEVDRQTLLFSATVPQSVMGLVRQSLKPDFHFVQTVQEGDLPTHEKVPQKIVAVPGLENVMPTLLELCKREIEAVEQARTAGSEVKPFKAIVYFSSTANVQLGSEIFMNLKSGQKSSFGKHPLDPATVSVIHGKLTQERRTRVSEQFRRARSAILFSTDVTARGLDFPNVTHVIQIGVPPNREQYIHRIGRTGRGSNSGEGWLIIAQPELGEARAKLRGLPIKPDTSLEAAKVDMTAEAQLPASLAAILTQVGDATKMVDRETKANAYLAALGTCAASPKQTIQLLNQWTAFGWGWPAPPSINSNLARRLGFGNVPGINIRDRAAEPRDDSGSSGGFDRRGGGDRYGSRDRGDRGGWGGRGGRADRGDREDRSLEDQDRDEYPSGRDSQRRFRDRGSEHYGKGRNYGDRKDRISPGYGYHRNSDHVNPRLSRGEEADF